MEREILFRGKRLDNGEWVYGVPLYDWAPCTLKCKGQHGGELLTFLGWNDDCHEYDEFEVDPATVGQYTGLTDKNGVKIFEGDILCDDEPEDPSGKYLPVFGVVKFGEYKGEKTGGKYPVQSNDLGFFVEWADNEDDAYSETYRKDLGYWAKYPSCEIIGNIHDNPELLEVTP